MNVLMLCTKFSLDEHSPWLTNELADTLMSLGHKVTVVNLDWALSCSRSNFVKEMKSGVQVLTVGPVLINKLGRNIEKLVKWLLSSFRAWPKIKKFTKKKHYDLLIGFSPVTTVAYPLWRLMSRLNCPSYLVQWDFFPYHHQQIGLINNRFIFSLAYWIENKMIRKFEHIGCMSPKNIEYLYAHYSLRKEQKVHHLPIWGRGETLVNENVVETRMQYDLPANKVLAVFGGQLTKGRGIETILDVAKLANNNGASLGFVFVGSGPLEPIIQQRLTEIDNVYFLGKLSREEYLKIVSACDIGLVCTVAGVDVPTFPSKSIDYFRTKKPILAAVENTTDYGNVIADNEIGIVCNADDVPEIYKSLIVLIENPILMKEMGENGFKFYWERLHVDKIAEQLFFQTLNVGVGTPYAY